MNKVIIFEHFSLFIIFFPLYVNELNVNTVVFYCDVGDLLSSHHWSSYCFPETKVKSLFHSYLTHIMSSLAYSALKVILFCGHYIGTIATALNP